MKFVLICTEGSVTEPECIRALDIALKGQAPQQRGLFVEVIPIPIGGNQGHVKLIEKSNEQVELILKDNEQTISIASDGDIIDKWLICDYDEIDNTRDRKKLCVNSSKITMEVTQNNEKISYSFT